MPADDRRWRWTAAFATAILSALCFLQWSLLSFERPYIFSAATLSSPLSSLQDFAGLLMGCRRLAADIAWIQTLQYYGTPEGIAPEEEEENGGGHYPLFLDYCERVAHLDPHFTYVYYYGGGALGWNLKRLDQAEALLKLGIENNPSEWRLGQYLAGLAYQKDHDVQKLTIFLQSFVGQPECPNLLRALLANIYKKQHRYRDAIAVWEIVLQSGEPADVHRAIEQIRILLPLVAPKAQSSLTGSAGF